nr:immunoglobulin heavy chain junction region [Macaca mulatta]
CTRAPLIQWEQFDYW